jgi:hypothetical protein
MTPDTLVPVGDDEFDAADSMLAALSDIAYSAAPIVKTKAKERTRKSRFFFKLSPSFSEDVDRKKKTFAPRELHHVDEEVTRRLKEYRKKIPEELSGNIDAVREFFLNEIAPITLAAGAGASQAQEIVKRLVKSDIDGTQFEKFERMMAKAVDIKMARFIARQLGLTKVEASEILEAMKPRQQPQIVPIGVPQHEGQNNARREQRQKQKDKTSADIQRAISRPNH